MPFSWRPDGDLARDVPAARRIMPFIMRGRNESAVFFEQRVDMSRTLPWLEAFRSRSGLRASVLHLLIWAAAQTLAARPRLNRFTAGGRIYQRRGIWVSFSAKKQKSDDAPIVVVKREIDPALSLEELVRQLESGIAEGRSERRSATDKELSILLGLPALLLSWLVRLQRLLDQLGLLPAAFYRNDPMYASVFIANLGSIDMDPCFHHLYEYGNIPIFIVAGRARNELMAGPSGEPVARPIMTLRYTFDERIDDGLYCARALELLKSRLEDPEAHVRLPLPASPGAC
jgi:hypothetical protein